MNEDLSQPTANPDLESLLHRIEYQVKELNTVKSNLCELADSLYGSIPREAIAETASAQTGLIPKLLYLSDCLASEVSGVCIEFDRIRNIG